MRILHVLESYLPQVTGMSEVVRQLSERLVLWGHDVTVATSPDSRRQEKVIQGVKVIEFDVVGNVVRGIFGAQKDYQNYLVNEAFDVVTFFAAQQWATDLALPILGQISAKKVFVPTGFSGFYQSEYGAYFDQMKSWMLGFDYSVFLSEDYRDINFARSLGITAYGIIPNGADEREFIPPQTRTLRNKLGIPEANMLLLTVGSHTGKKGHREAIEIFRHLTTRLGVTLLLVGNVQESGTGLQKFIRVIKEVTKKILRYQGGGDCQGYCTKMECKLADPTRHRQLLVKSLSRAATVEAYFEADAFLFPSNIECSPIVLFESNAAGTPFFVTDVGNAKEIADWTGGGIILPTDFTKDNLSHAKIEESADLIDGLLHDASRLAEMGRKGQVAWRSRFTWEGISRQYENLYKTLVGHDR